MGALRLFLAFGVVFAHAGHDIVRPHGLYATNAWWLHMAGGRAVIFFYIISGFLISYALYEKYPPTRAGTIAFFTSRFLRIFPLWWSLLIICLLFTPWPSPHSPLVIVPAVMLFGTDWLMPFWEYPQRYWAVFPPSLAVGWTLGAEITFYLMAPWVLRSGKIAGALFLTSACVRLCVNAFAQDGSPGTPTDLYITWDYFFFPATLVFFMFGHFANVFARSLPLGTKASLVALVLAATLSAFMPAFIDPLPSYLTCACFAAALPGLFAVTKDSRIFNFFGDLTYPLYLTHVMTITALFGPWRVATNLGSLLFAGAQSLGSATIGGIFLIAAIIGIATIVAIAAHFLIERPARSAASFFLRRIVSGRWTRNQQPGLPSEGI
jgi:peptidoglycan/LPS O-acetylase OafA/YrhL